MKLRIFYIILVCLFSISWSYSQEGESPSFGDRFVFGGDLQMQFGTISYIGVSPLVGYYINPRWMAGIGGKYLYFKIPLTDSTSAKTHCYGGSVFTSYILIKDLDEFIPLGLNAGITANIEYEALSLEKRYFMWNAPPDATGRYIEDFLYIGGGLRFPIGRKSSFNMEILWNVIETEQSIYPNPRVRFGVMF